MEFISENWAQVIIIILAALRLAEAVAHLTPTGKDNAIIRKIKNAVMLFSQGGEKDNK